MTKFNEIKFAELKPWEINFIESMDVDDFIITGEQVK